MHSKINLLVLYNSVKHQVICTLLSYWLGYCKINPLKFALKKKTHAKFI